MYVAWRSHTFARMVTKWKTIGLKCVGWKIPSIADHPYSLKGNPPLWIFPVVRCCKWIYAVLGPKVSQGDTARWSSGASSFSGGTCCHPTCHGWQWEIHLLFMAFMSIEMGKSANYMGDCSSPGAHVWLSEDVRGCVRHQECYGMRCPIFGQTHITTGYRTAFVQKLQNKKRVSFCDKRKYMGGCLQSLGYNNQILSEFYPVVSVQRGRHLNPVGNSAKSLFGMSQSLFPPGKSLCFWWKIKILDGEQSTSNFWGGKTLLNC